MLSGSTHLGFHAGTMRKARSERVNSESATMSGIEHHGDKHNETLEQYQDSYTLRVEVDL